ncbi:MAG: c-type cytochrome [Anaerolineae bacterium]|nr:c-type cytochrome [Anaerolineae bacterium]
MSVVRKPEQNQTINYPLVIAAIVVWTIISFIVGLYGAEWFMPEAATVEADAVDNLFRFMLGFGTFIFLLVETLIFYFAIRYGFMRDRNDESDGPPVHGNNTVEIVWTIIPAIIVFALTIYSFQVLIDTTEAKDGEREIKVTGQQFFWSFEYPDEQYQLKINHILVVPEDQAIKLAMNSEDVIHAFWVPAFRVKQDVMPGRTSNLRFTANKHTGLPDPSLINIYDPTLTVDQIDELDFGYEIVCAELCGALHGRMRGKAFVVTDEEYEEFLEGLREIEREKERQRQEALENLDALKELGRTLFATYGCNACHQLTDANSLNMGQGPSLNGLEERAATYPGYESAEDYIHTSIINPNAHVVEGYAPGIMPQNFASRIPPEDLDILVTYLAAPKDN